MSHAPGDPVEQTADDPVQPAAETPDAEGALVEADLLVEDVSIDGMCGVY